MQKLGNLKNSLQEAQQELDGDFEEREAIIDELVTENQGLRNLLQLPPQFNLPGTGNPVTLNGENEALIKMIEDGKKELHQIRTKRPNKI